MISHQKHAALLSTLRLMFLVCFFLSIALGVTTSNAASQWLSKESNALTNHELFAVLNTTHFAESLPFGPSPIVEGTIAYLSTNTTNKNLLHTEWVQVVTSTRNTSDEYTITWTFPTAGTLQDHFVTAVTTGVMVNFLVEQGNVTTYVTNRWQFSPSVENMSDKFAVNATTIGFSDQFGVWGCCEMYTGVVWGVGNYSATDRFCSQYQKGFEDSITHMYYSTSAPAALP